MDTITSTTMEKAGEMLAAMDPVQTGNVHTVTLTLDGRTGGCKVSVESEMHSDVVFDVV